MSLTIATTADLRLRSLSARDLPAFQAYRGDPKVAAMQGWTPMTDAQAAGFLGAMAVPTLFPLGEWVQLGVACRRDDLLVGDLGICVAKDETEAELGISLARAAQGQGWGLQAVNAICAVIFQRTKVARIVAITDVRNAAALALLERSAFAYVETWETSADDGPLREHVYHMRRPM